MAEEAHVIVTHDAERGFYHVQCHTFGDSVDRARGMAHAILGFLAEGRMAFIRCPPEAHSQTNFNTNTTVNAGYVRFSFRDEPGDWRPGEEAPVEEPARSADTATQMTNATMPTQNSKPETCTMASQSDMPITQETVEELESRLRAAMPEYERATQIQSRMMTAGDDGTWSGETDPVRVMIYATAVLAGELAAFRREMSDQKGMVSVPHDTLATALDEAESNCRATQAESSCSEDDDEVYAQQRARIAKLRSAAVDVPVTLSSR